MRSSSACMCMIMSLSQPALMLASNLSAFHAVQTHHSDTKTYGPKLVKIGTYMESTVCKVCEEDVGQIDAPSGRLICS